MFEKILNGINSGESFLGEEIKEWCMNSYGTLALMIKSAYYSDNVQFKPSDSVYYFIDLTNIDSETRKPISQPSKDWKIQLIRDLEKSPRKYNQ